MTTLPSAPTVPARATGEGRRGAQHSTGELFAAARAGDERAWAALVRRLEPMLRGTARRYGLSAERVDDVVQTAWLRLFERVGDVRAPEAVGAWLAVTVRREAFRVLQEHVREHLTDDPLVGEAAGADGIEAQVLATELRGALTRAIGTLPERHRPLLELMLSEPGLDYRRITERTGIPTGSIGPIRGRCFGRMAVDPEIRALRG